MSSCWETADDFAHFCKSKFPFPKQRLLLPPLSRELAAVLVTSSIEIMVAAASAAVVVTSLFENVATASSTAVVATTSILQGSIFRQPSSGFWVPKSAGRHSSRSFRGHGTGSM